MPILPNPFHVLGILLTLAGTASAQPTAPNFIVRQTLPDSIAAGQPLTMDVVVKNTGDRSADNVLLGGLWTQGYEVADSLIPIEGRRTWNLGTIEAGQSRTLKLTLKPSANPVPTEFRSSFDVTYRMTTSDAQSIKVVDHSEEGKIVPVQPGRPRVFAPRGLPVAPLNSQPCPPAIPAPSAPGATPPALPTPEEIARNTPNAQNAFASPTEGGGTAPRAFNDNFNGDFGGIAIRVRRAVGSVGSTSTITQDRQETGVSGPFGPITTETVAGPSTSATTYQDFFIAAGARYGGILITENDSPRPTTRFYLGANYYGGLNASLNPAPVNGTGTTTATSALPNSTDSTDSGDFVLTNRSSTTTTNSQQNIVNLARAAAVRQTVGFEYAFADDSASFGLRLPFQQNLAAGGLGGNYLGDLSVLLKYAFYDNRRTGDLLSAGLVVTTPIGNDPQFILADGSQLPVSVLYQPWLGGIRMFERGYVQGISSVLMPSNATEPTLFNNSIAAAYFLYKNDSARFLKLVAPAVEAHVRTPLNNRDPNGSIYVQDQVNLTSSIHFRFDRVTVTPAFAVPLVGPTPWNYEGILWVNVRF